MDLIGKTLYIIKGNMQYVERGLREQFDVDIIETKIVKKVLDPMIYAKTVMGYQTNDIVFGTNWFCEDWLDDVDEEEILYFKHIDKRYGTQVVITLDKAKGIKYRELLLKELNYTVKNKYIKIKQDINKLLESSYNLVDIQFILEMEGMMRNEI